MAPAIALLLVITSVVALWLQLAGFVVVSRATRNYSPSQLIGDSKRARHTILPAWRPLLVGLCYALAAVAAAATATSVALVACNAIGAWGAWAFADATALLGVPLAAIVPSVVAQDAVTAAARLPPRRGTARAGAGGAAWALGRKVLRRRRSGAHRSQRSLGSVRRPRAAHGFGTNPDGPRAVARAPAVADAPGGLRAPRGPGLWLRAESGPPGRGRAEPSPQMRRFCRRGRRGGAPPHVADPGRRAEDARRGYKILARPRPAQRKLGARPGDDADEGAAAVPKVDAEFGDLDVLSAEPGPCAAVTAEARGDGPHRRFDEAAGHC